MSDHTERRGEVRNRVGISRRDLLRRGAIVGGTALWTVPVIASLTRAHIRPGSPAFSCCRCHAPSGRVPPGPPNPPKMCTTTVDNPTACEQFCEERGYRQSQFHQGPQPILCRSNGNCETPH
jgi:hypothetical protein